MTPAIAAVLIGTVAFITLVLGAYVIGGGRLDVGKRLGVEEREQASELPWQPHVRRKEAAASAPGQPVAPASRSVSSLQVKLRQAGIRRQDASMLFACARVAIAMAFFIALSVKGYFGFNPVLCGLFSVLLGGVLIPNYWLSRRVSRRKERIRIGLADALDLTVVCVEAGLGLDQSLMRIGQEMKPFYPELSYELLLVALDVNAGRSREEALKSLAKRTDIEDIRVLTAILIQTDRYGTSISQALRSFASGMRTKRRQLAEERGAELGAKMIPPMVFFIFPAMFVVTAGPAVITVMKTLQVLGKH